MTADPGIRDIIADACHLAAWAQAAGFDALAARALDDAQAFLDLAAFDDLGPVSVSLSA